VSAEHNEKGKYETFDGLKTCKLLLSSSSRLRRSQSQRASELLTTNVVADITGPAGATRAVITIYDAFGFASQTLQGADRLAEHMGDTLVLVPDFLEGDYARHEWIPPNTPEKQKAFQNFIGGPANIPKAVKRLVGVRGALAERYPGVNEHVAVGGLCWGG
jgi:dienelactone hydrolase